MTLDPWVQIAIAFVAALPGLLALRANSRKIVADASEANTRANVSLVKPLADRIDSLEVEAEHERGERRRIQSELDVEREARRELERRLAVLDRERQEWKMGIGLLLGQLVTNNIEPTWKPRDTGPMGRLQIGNS